MNKLEETQKINDFSKDSDIFIYYKIIVITRLRTRL